MLFPSRPRTLDDIDVMSFYFGEECTSVVFPCIRGLDRCMLSTGQPGSPTRRVDSQMIPFSPTVRGDDDYDGAIF